MCVCEKRKPLLPSWRPLRFTVLLWCSISCLTASVQAKKGQMQGTGYLYILLHCKVRNTVCSGSTPATGGRFSWGHCSLILSTVEFPDRASRAARGWKAGCQLVSGDSVKILHPCMVWKVLPLSSILFIPDNGSLRGASLKSTVSSQRVCTDWSVICRFINYQIFLTTLRRTIVGNWRKQYLPVWIAN